MPTAWPSFPTPPTTISLPTRGRAKWLLASSMPRTNSSPTSPGASSDAPRERSLSEATMSTSTVLTPAGEPVLIITRVFDAPRVLVYKCYTDPVHMVHFWGPHGSTTPVCQVDLRPGGLWRTVMRFADGSEYGYS